MAEANCSTPVGDANGFLKLIQGIGIGKTLFVIAFAAIMYHLPTLIREYRKTVVFRMELKLYRDYAAEQDEVRRRTLRENALKRLGEIETEQRTK